MNRVKLKKKTKHIKKQTVIVQDVENKAKHKSIKGVTLENKIGQQKSTCIDCDSKKSTFLKKIAFTNYKTCQFIGKTVKKHTECTYTKKLVLISDKKANAKSKCAKFLTDRTFFGKINDEYDLEQLVKHSFLY